MIRSRSSLRALVAAVLALAVLGHPFLMSGAMPCGMGMPAHGVMGAMVRSGASPAGGSDHRSAPAPRDDHGAHDCCMCVGACGVAILPGSGGRHPAVLLGQVPDAPPPFAESESVPFVLPPFVLPFAQAPPVRA